MDTFISADAGWEISSVLVAAVVVLSVVVYRLVSNHGPSLPPGPYGLPLFGYLPFLGDKPCRTLAGLARDYGPVFSLRLGTRLVIVLGNYDVIREAFVLKANTFSNRPSNNAFSEVLDYHHAGYHGSEWTELSKFLDKCMKDLGAGTAIVEAQILDEIDIFLATLRAKVKEASGGPVSFRRDLGASVANNACVMTFGRRFDYDDPNFHKLKDNEDAVTVLYNSVSWRFLFPFLSWIPGSVGSFAQSPLRFRGNKFQKFAKEIISDHQSNPEKYRNRDFIFDFLDEQKNRLRNNIPLGGFTDDRMHGTLMALFGGGSQTVESTISWFIVMMLHHPSLQSRIHAELDAVIGRDRPDYYLHRKRTPLLEATIMEIERAVSVVPINVPHSNSEEVTFRGYRIPKGSYILSNFWGAHHDPDKWTDPDQFNPDRFLVGDIAVRPENLIPFSVGKRACPGESLAKMEMYLYMASLLQNFQIMPLEGASLPPLPLEIDDPGLVWHCPEFQIRLILR